MSKRTKQMIMTVLGTFLTGSLGLLVWHWLQPDPLPLAPASRPVVSRNRQQPVSPAHNAEPQGNGANADQTPAVVPTVPVAGNLLALTTERAKVDTLKVLVTAADLNAKLGKTGAGASRPVVAPPPVPPLPELPAPAAPLAASPRIVSGPPRVVSIYGVNGSISATIRHKGKLSTLRNGERFNGGTAMITRNGVQIRSGKTTTLLDFE